MTNRGLGSRTGFQGEKELTVKDVADENVEEEALLRNSTASMGA